MKVDYFFTILNEQLEVYKHQYERQDEGTVYIGLPDFDFSNLTKDEKTYFVYYLSFFVAFDLLVYSYDNPNYRKQKEKLKIPKFEYGLTNIFVYPNKIYDKYWEPFRPEIFKVVFLFGIQHLKFELPEINPIVIFKHAINDKDFSIGIFNNELLNEIKTAANTGNCCTTPFF